MKHVLQVASSELRELRRRGFSPKLQGIDELPLDLSRLADRQLAEALLDIRNRAGGRRPPRRAVVR